MVVFADPNSATSTTLTAAVLPVAPRVDVEIVGVVDAGLRSPRRGRLVRTLGARLARSAFEPSGRFLEIDRVPLLRTVRWLARRYRVPVLTPPGRRVNDPQLVSRVRDMRPDGALALAVGQVFEPALLEACRAPVNYHNGLLPSYRGIGATAWSVYDGAPRSGFAYHRMTERVDEGSVLVRDALPVPADAGTADVETEKTRLAATRMDEALALMVAGDPGEPQRGEATTFTSAQRAAMRRVGDPSTLTWDELERRLRAFELIELELAGSLWEVTALRRIDDARAGRGLEFTTADGVRAAPHRFVHLPLALYRAYRPLRRRGC